MRGTKRDLTETTTYQRGLNASGIGGGTDGRGSLIGPPTGPLGLISQSLNGHSSPYTRVPIHCGLPLMLGRIAWDVRLIRPATYLAGQVRPNNFMGMPAQK